MLIDEIDFLHQGAHNTPTYEEAMEAEDVLINIAIARGELLLLLLGLAFVEANFPCLYPQLEKFQERLSELLDAQVPEDYKAPEFGDDE